MVFHSDLLNSEINKFLGGFEKKPAANSVVIEKVVQELDLDLPSDYLNLFSNMNGGEGFIGHNYCRLYSIEDLISLNDAFGVKDFAPELFIFGSNGIGAAFAFDTWKRPISIVQIPFIPMDFKYAEQLGTTINEFFVKLSGRTEEKTKHEPMSINKNFIGKELHEIQPIVFGGDPHNPSDKTLLDTEDYAKLVVFWNRVYKDKVK